MTALDAFRATHGEPTWDDIVTGHDFGFLGSAEIQAWAAGEGPAVLRLKALEGEGLRTFEAHLWAACAEAVGKTPRPGSARAQPHGDHEILGLKPRAFVGGAHHFHIPFTCLVGETEMRIGRQLRRFQRLDQSIPEFLERGQVNGEH